MNINEKQRLWSKYYLTQVGRKDNLASLNSFLDKELPAFGLHRQSISHKKIKLLRYMLMMLNKKTIFTIYCHKGEKFSKMTKNEMINAISKYIMSR